jgi:hypothetical protein
MRYGRCVTSPTTATAWASKRSWKRFSGIIRVLKKGHNTNNRGKKAYRPVLCFIEQTRAYLLGKLRKGETISGKETFCLA